MVGRDAPEGINIKARNLIQVKKTMITDAGFSSWLDRLQKLMLVVYGLLMASAAEGVRVRRGEGAKGRD